MALQQLLKTRYPNRLTVPTTVDDLPRLDHVVYGLTYDDTPLVVDWGRRHRAKVIFDDQTHSTPGHRHALQVRICRLFGQGVFQRFMLDCPSKYEAQAIVKSVRQELGGLSLDLPSDILTAFFKDIPVESPAHLVLQMALCAGLDGLADLKRWRRARVLPDEVWHIIGDRLRLDDPLQTA